MSLNEPAQCIAYLIKTTKCNADGVRLLVSDYNVRASNNTLESKPNEFDSLVKSAVDYLESKDISVSSLLAKWNSYCYNLKDEYCDQKWLDEGEYEEGKAKEEGIEYHEVVGQEGLNNLINKSWSSDDDSLYLEMPSSVAVNLRWSGYSGSVADRYTLGSMEITKSNNDILGAGVFRIRLDKGITLEGWDGITLKDDSCLSVNGKKRFTQSEALWKEYQGDSQYKDLWNAALKGFKIASGYGSMTTGGRIYEKVYAPVTEHPLWPEALLSAAALGGVYGEDLKNTVESYIWVSANSETKGYSGEDSSSRPFQVLANRVNILAEEVGAARYGK
jgi:hypothetical protein